MNIQNEINDDNLLNFSFSILNNIWTKKYSNNYNMKYMLEISYNSNFIITEFYNVLEDKEKRLKYFECGKKDAELFIKSFE